jgi:hypothetical protein
VHSCAEESIQREWIVSNTFVQSSKTSGTSKYRPCNLPCRNLRNANAKNGYSVLKVAVKFSAGIERTSLERGYSESLRLPAQPRARSRLRLPLDTPPLPICYRQGNESAVRSQQRIGRLRLYRWQQQTRRLRFLSLPCLCEWPESVY